MAMLLGKKIGMTRIYDEAGRLVPATVIQAGPCIVTQIKSQETDGYCAVQMGYDDVKPARRKKPEIGHSAKASAAPKRFVREMRLVSDGEYQLGDALTVSSFAETKTVDITGVSKGRGFSGGMRRHGFGGFPASHGTERKHRAPGSIGGHANNAGGGAGPKKGKRMAGQFGNVNVTTKNHSLLVVDEEKNLLVIKGGIPGPAGGYCVVRSAKSPV
ncbi:50S ribosomal protein L3 [Planctomycetota bacterium]